MLSSLKSWCGYLLDNPCVVTGSADLTVAHSSGPSPSCAHFPCLPLASLDYVVVRVCLLQSVYCKLAAFTFLIMNYPLSWKTSIIGGTQCWLAIVMIHCSDFSPQVNWPDVLSNWSRVTIFWFPKNRTLSSASGYLNDKLTLFLKIFKNTFNGRVKNNDNQTFSLI